MGNILDRMNIDSHPEAPIKLNMHAFELWVEVFRVFREYTVLRGRPEPAGGFTPRVQLFRRCNLKE